MSAADGLAAIAAGPEIRKAIPRRRAEAGNTAAEPRNGREKSGKAAPPALPRAFRAAGTAAPDAIERQRAAAVSGRARANGLRPTQLSQPEEGATHGKVLKHARS
jgi:hypothetical protein